MNVTLVLGLLGAVPQDAAFERGVPARSFVWGDYDADRLTDLLVFAPEGAASLFRNRGDGDFEEVTLAAGLAALARVRFGLWQDVEMDGDLDLLVGEAQGPVRLFSNQGDASFVESASFPEPALAAEFLDYDQDGLPDLELWTARGGDLHHNEGGGRFERVALGAPRDASVSGTFPSGAIPRVEAGPEPTPVAGENRAASGSRRPIARLPDPGPAGRAEDLAPSAGDPLDAVALASCARTIEDKSNPGAADCLSADTTPTLGRLYPLSAELFVDDATGNVGIGTTAPDARLDVASGEVHVDNDAGFATIVLDGDNDGAGQLQLKTDDGTTRVELLAGYLLDGSSAQFRAQDGTLTVFLDGESTNSGGMILVSNDAAEPTLQLIGDTGYGDSGELALFDATNDARSVTLRGRDSSGTGGELLMTGASGILTVDLDADNAGGGIHFNEDDGSTMCDFVATVYTFNDAAGATTISFNRLTGAKSAVVDTPSYGERLFYCMESPELWFEDFGSARLVDGVARVRLDPIFLEAVTVDEAHPMLVFLTPAGRTSGLWVEKGRDHFVVREAPGATGTVAFDWRVVAKRKGLEALRLDPFVPEPEPQGRSAAASSEPRGGEESEQRGDS